jgi:hypothetical protein
MCLIGIWQVQTPEVFLRLSIPPGAFDLSTVRFLDSTGGMAYRFDEQGVLTIEAVQFQGNFEVTIDNVSEPLMLLMSGFASGAYKVQGDILSIEQKLTSDIDYRAVYGGEDMMSDAQVDQFAPLFVPPYTKGRFTCTPKTLTLEILNFPGMQEAIHFVRLR